MDQCHSAALTMFDFDLDRVKVVTGVLRNFLYLSARVNGNHCEHRYPLAATSFVIALVG
jgi:hypothetical protein